MGGKCPLRVVNAHALCTPLNEALPIAFLMFMAYLGSLPDHVWRTRVGLIHLFISDSNCLRSSMTFVWFISISNESITFWKHLTSRKPHVGLWRIFFLFSILSVLAALLGYQGLDWTSLLWPQWRKEPIPSATVPWGLQAALLLFYFHYNLCRV